MVAGLRCFGLGVVMRIAGVIAAAVVAIVAAQAGWAADKASNKASGNCVPAIAGEAEQALRFMTELGIASNACSSVAIYADFRTRNRDAILSYQKIMISHLHGAPAFDRWNTILANQLAQQQSSISPTQFCQQAQPLLQQASMLDMKAFRTYAAAQAAAARAQTASCGK